MDGFDKEWMDFCKKKSPIKIDGLDEMDQELYRLTCRFFFNLGNECTRERNIATTQYLNPKYSKEAYSSRTEH